MDASALIKAFTLLVRDVSVLRELDCTCWNEVVRLFSAEPALVLSCRSAEEGSAAIIPREASEYIAREVSQKIFALRLPSATIA